MVKEKSESGKQSATASDDYIAYGDEISIAQLVLDMGRQWKVVVSVAALFVVVALIYDFFTPSLYRYTLDLEIGRDQKPKLPENTNFIFMPGSRVPIVGFETKGAVESQLDHALIPQAIDYVDDQNGGNDEESYPLDVHITNPDDSEGRDSLIMRMSLLAPKQEDKRVFAILENAGARMAAKHTEFLEGIRKQKTLMAEAFLEKMEHIDKTLAENQERIRQLQYLIDSSKNGALAAAVELNTLIPDQQRLLKEKEEITSSVAGLENESKMLRSAIEEFKKTDLNSEVLSGQLQNTAVLKANFSILPTRVLSLAYRSRGPVGVDPKLIVLLALVLGVGVGLVLSMIVQAVIRERSLTSPG